MKEYTVGVLRWGYTVQSDTYEVTRSTSFTGSSTDLVEIVSLLSKRKTFVIDGSFVYYFVS